MFFDRRETRVYGFGGGDGEGLELFVCADRERWWDGEAVGRVLGVGEVEEAVVTTLGAEGCGNCREECPIENLL